MAVEDAAEPAEGVEQLATDIAALTTLETQETHAEMQSETEVADFGIYSGIQDFVDHHSASGVLNRDEFANILTLDDDSSFMAELVPIFTTDMEAFFTRAAAWVEQLPEIPEHERNSGLPSEIRRVYDNFNVRLAACTSAYTMGALRLKDALWELRNRKHAYDAQGCKEALRVAELAYPEFKGVLEDFLELHCLPHGRRTIFVQLMTLFVRGRLYASSAGQSAFHGS